MSTIQRSERIKAGPPPSPNGQLKAGTPPAAAASAIINVDTEARPGAPRALSSSAMVVLALSAALIGWVFWPTIAELAAIWADNPLYSHGYFIPCFAAILLWKRRDRIPAGAMRPSLWGFPLVLLGVAMRLGAAYFYITWPERVSLIPVLLGVVLCLGGRGAFRWAWPSIVFLLFMVPFPGATESLLVRPMQRLATIASTNVLQTVGVFAQADGNVIVLSEVEMGIVEACSGLRMLSVFVALSVAVAIVLRRPLLQKLLIALSAIPIALVCNVARISVTGVLYEIADPEWAQFVFHDIAGWLMMPLALLCLAVEFKLLSVLFVQEPAEATKPPALAVAPSH